MIYTIIRRAGYVVEHIEVSRRIRAANWAVDKVVNGIPYDGVKYIQGDELRLRFDPPIYSMYTIYRLLRVWKSRIRGKWKAREE